MPTVWKFFKAVCLPEKTQIDSQSLCKLLKVTEVTTEHQKKPSIKSFVLPEGQKEPSAKGQSLPQELEENPHSGLFLLVI